MSMNQPLSSTNGRSSQAAVRVRESAQVRGQINIHVAEQVGRAFSPGCFDCPATAFLFHMHDAHSLTRLRQRVGDLDCPVRRGIVRNDHFEFEPTMLGKKPMQLRQAPRQSRLLVEDRYGDVDEHDCDFIRPSGSSQSATRKPVSCNRARNDKARSLVDPS